MHCTMIESKMKGILFPFDGYIICVNHEKQINIK